MERIIYTVKIKRNRGTFTDTAFSSLKRKSNLHENPKSHRKNLSENEENSTFSDSKEYETTEIKRIGDVDDETGTTENYKTKTEEKMAEDSTDPKIKLVAMDNKEQEAEKTATAADFTCPISFKKFYS